jgi:hypothetical protein
MRTLSRILKYLRLVLLIAIGGIAFAAPPLREPGPTGDPTFKKVD